MAQEFLTGVSLASPDPLGDATREETLETLRGLSQAGARWVRILLPWSELQPERHRVPEKALRRLELWLDHLEKRQLRGLVVFFCAGLDRAEWLPYWMCDRLEPEPEVVDFYRDRELIGAQQLQLSVVADAFSGHDGLGGWDLGRQTSRLATPPDPESARSWLLWLLEALKSKDERHPVTFTLSTCDFDQDQGLRPSRMAEELDWLSLRVDPQATRWSESTAEPEGVGWLCAVARRLSRKPVHLSELVLPSPAKTEAAWLDKALESARRSGAQGALLWLESDRLKTLFAEPPVELVEPEGLEGQAEAFRRFSLSRPLSVKTPPLPEVEEDSFYETSAEELKSIYERYRERLAGEPGESA